MVLGTIGLAFYLANGLGWAPTEVAATYALTVLFMRTPLVLAVAAIPAQISGRVALDKVESLALAEHQESFDVAPTHIAGQWQTLELRDVEYHYPAQGDEPGFDVGPVNLTLRRGETVFLMGGNGSGKSSLARLLSGLYRPSAGAILVDGQVIGSEDWMAYRQLFASVFTDFHLFAQLLGADGQNADRTDIEHWLEQLHMKHKVQLGDGHLLDTRFSQGQRKRLALMLALLEKRDILLLDEWAADQDPLTKQPLASAVMLMRISLNHFDACELPSGAGDLAARPAGVDRASRLTRGKHGTRLRLHRHRFRPVEPGFGHRHPGACPAQWSGAPRRFVAMDVLSRDKNGEVCRRRARNLVFGIGGIPQAPAAFDGLEDARVLHSAGYRGGIEKLLANRPGPLRVAVVGG
nr:P-glycoprotein 13 [Tanacetum cinerariifolium]